VVEPAEQPGGLAQAQRLFEAQGARMEPHHRGAEGERRIGQAIGRLAQGLFAQDDDVATFQDRRLAARHPGCAGEQGLHVVRRHIVEDIEARLKGGWPHGVCRMGHRLVPCRVRRSMPSG
jgi:hypothetical protein